MLCKQQPTEAYFDLLDVLVLHIACIGGQRRRPQQIYLNYTAMSQNVPCGRVLVLVVLVGILCSHTDAQSAQQVLNSLPYQTSSTLTSLTSASYYQNGVTLPTCPRTPALSPTILSDVWGSLPLSDQVKTTAMPYVIQLSHAVYRFFYDKQSQKYPDPSTNPYKDCLAAMGMAMPIQTGSNYIEVTNTVGARLTALVVQQSDGNGVFVIFKGTDFGNPGDVATDGDCQQQVTGVKAYLGASIDNIGVHRGFYNSWKLLEPMVLKALPQLPSNTKVYIIGHSLGGGMGAIAALRLQFKGYNIAGVWLFGQPRVGNGAWQTQYNIKLLSKTLRISNYADLVARVPATVQICPLSLLPNTYRHIGKSVLLCPVTSGPNAGLVKWQLNETGLTETLDCTPLDIPDASLKTHWLGAYIDAWRRAAASEGVDISPVVANTICKECTGCFLPDLNKQVNVVARAGGPIMCSTAASCNVQTAWNAATLLAGNSYMREYQTTSTCLNYMCTYTTTQSPMCPTS